MANVLGASTFQMLLWLTFWAHRLRQCCCGKRSGHIDVSNVAVANVLGTSALQMLLWLTFWAHRLCKCFCGQCSGNIDFENVAMANALVSSILKMLLWLRFWECQNPRKRVRFMLAQRNHLPDVSKFEMPGPVPRRW